MIDKQRLALRINEIFHDIEGKEYQKKHDDIFSGEALRWKESAKKYFQDYKTPITILDIGTGTGFIPLNTAEYLSENDTFLCSDISQEMLDVASKNIIKENFICQFKFLKSDGNEINVNNNKVLIITMNSVVHHIPNLSHFFTQLNDIILPGGRIIIGHEPNKLFYTTKSLINRYLLFHTFSSPKKLTTTIARKTGLSLLIKKIPKGLVAERIVTIHHDQEKKEVVFELNEESAGTRRLIDLAPVFFDPENDGRTIIIDEMDRSLHPTITRLLHKAHYEDLSNENNQLIIATHEHYLLSQDYFRRDEIWFVEKDRTGNSELFSLTEFDGVRFDKDIQKDYLIGRYGAVPNIGTV